MLSFRLVSVRKKMFGHLLLGEDLHLYTHTEVTACVMYYLSLGVTCLPAFTRGSPVQLIVICKCMYLPLLYHVMYAYLHTKASLLPLVQGCFGTWVIPKYVCACVREVTTVFQLDLGPHHRAGRQYIICWAPEDSTHLIHTDRKCIHH